jgi:hypothetical protein
MLTLEPETRLADEAAGAVSGLEAGAAEEPVVEALDGMLDDDGGFIWLTDREAPDAPPPHPNATSTQKLVSMRAPIFSFTYDSFRKR